MRKLWVQVLQARETFSNASNFIKGEYSAFGDFFNFLLPVWKCDEILTPLWCFFLPYKHERSTITFSNASNFIRVESLLRFKSLLSDSYSTFCKLFKRVWFNWPHCEIYWTGDWRNNTEQFVAMSFNIYKRKYTAKYRVQKY